MKDNTLIIIDWDDTLYPTSWIRNNDISKNERKIAKLDGLIARFLKDANEYANIFYVYGTDNWDKMIWHSIYSNTDRFSLGFNIHPEGLKNDLVVSGKVT